MKMWRDHEIPQFRDNLKSRIIQLSERWKAEKTIQEEESKRSGDVLKVEASSFEERTSQAPNQPPILDRNNLQRLVSTVEDSEQVEWLQQQVAHMLEQQHDLHHFIEDCVSTVQRKMLAIGEKVEEIRKLVEGLPMVEGTSRFPIDRSPVTKPSVEDRAPPTHGAEVERMGTEMQGTVVEGAREERGVNGEESGGESS